MISYKFLLIYYAYILLNPCDCSHILIMDGSRTNLARSILDSLKNILLENGHSVRHYIISGETLGTIDSRLVKAADAVVSMEKQAEDLKILLDINSKTTFIALHEDCIDIPYEDIKNEYVFIQILQNLKNYFLDYADLDLTLFNCHPQVTGSALQVPMKLEVLGINFHQRSLSEELEEFLSCDTGRGVIYFDLGDDQRTLIKRSEEKHFKDVLSKLDVKVVWRSRDTDYFRKNDKDFFYLEDISHRSGVLGRNDTKVFISSCDANSMNLGAYYGVPMFCIEEEQKYSKFLVETQRAISVNISQLTRNKIGNSVLILLLDRYQANAKETSDLIHATSSHQLVMDKINTFFRRNHGRPAYYYPHSVLGWEFIYRYIVGLLGLFVVFIFIWSNEPLLWYIRRVFLGLWWKILDK